MKKNPQIFSPFQINFVYFKKSVYLCIVILSRRRPAGNKDWKRDSTRLTSYASHKKDFRA